MTDVSGQAYRWLSALVILSAVSACDNVEWGGAEVRLESPPPSPVTASEPAESVDPGPADPVLPESPVLFMGYRDDGGTSLVPVGVIEGDSLAALPDEEDMPGFEAAFVRERMAPGTEFVLFAEGTRVGTLTAREHGVREDFCRTKPSVSGPVELVPEAMSARRFLALRREDAGGRVHGEYGVTPDDRAQWVASLELAGQTIPRVGARWPQSLAGIRQELRAFRLGAEGPRAFAVTFTYRDQLAIREASPDSYALFLVGVSDGTAYRPAYVWYREAAREGRGVPRFFSRMDWDGDGETEILLEVLGEASRWTAAVDRVGGEWRRVWQDPCGADAPPVAEDEGG
jgi:hypothetical protein